MRWRREERAGDVRAEKLESALRVGDRSESNDRVHEQGEPARSRLPVPGLRVLDLRAAKCRATR